MKYVLDASAAMKWALPDPLSPRALHLRDEYRQQVHQLIAPSIFPGEIASGLTKAERQKLIPVGEAYKLLAKISATMPALQPYGLILFRATEISSQTRSAVYDCLYVALAERESCELVTTDDKLIRNLLSRFPFIRHLSTL